LKKSAVLSALMSVALLVRPAAAAPSGGGDLVGESADAEIVVWGSDERPEPTTPDATPSRIASNSRPYYWQSVAHSSNGTGLEHLCNASGAGGEVVFGWWYTIYKRSRATGAIEGEPTLRCVPFPPDTPTDEPPPPPVLPQPPTIGEIWDAASLPAPAIGISPTTQGVTGLETWLWANTTQSDVTVSAALNGFTVTGTAHIVGYSFDFGDGPPTETTEPGSEEHPAAFHTDETKGPYEVAVSTLWRGEFVMTGPEIANPLPVDLGTAQLTTRSDYRVIEIVPELVR
jgi:hypothetical protein